MKRVFYQLIPPHTKSYLTFKISLLVLDSVVVVSEIGDFSLESSNFGRSVVDDFIYAIVVKSDVLNVGVEDIKLLLKTVNITLKVIDGLHVHFMSVLEFSFVEDLTKGRMEVSEG